MTTSLEREPAAVESPHIAETLPPSDRESTSDLEKVITQPTVPSNPQPSPPPDGGLLAWLQVAGAFMCNFTSLGIVNSFGVFQSYYEQVLIPDRSPSSISWIGSFQGFLLFFISIVVGPLFDKGYNKTLLGIGTFFITFGLMMTSLCTQFYQLFLAHSVTTGFGLAFVFLPSIAIVTTYFSSRRALAVGIAVSGGGSGAIIYPIMFRQLIGPLGFGWTTRVMAFLTLGMLLFALAVLRTRLAPPKKARSLIDWSAFRELSFVLFCLACCLSFFGLYIPFFFLPTFLRVSLKETSSLDFYSISIMSAGSLVGRIFNGPIADKMGSINAIVPISIATTVLSLSWMGIRNVAGTIVFAALYGFFSGIMISMPLTIVSQLSPSLSVVGTRMGMVFLCTGAGIFFGSPIAGALIDLEKAVFWKAQLFAGIMLAAGALTFIALRAVEARRRGTWKL